MEMNGFGIPARGEAMWKLPEGDFSHAKLQVAALEYDSLPFSEAWTSEGSERGRDVANPSREVNICLMMTGPKPQ
jgi:hypothetical protein